MSTQLPAKINTQKSAAIHHLPHRTRYRVLSKHRNAKTMERVHNSIKALPGVKKVELNERTGSVLVHHEEMPEILLRLDDALNGIGLDLFEEIVDEELGILPGISLASNLVKSRFAGLNQYVARATNNYFDLKTLVPLALLAAGIYQTSKDRGLWSQMPGWVLFYYAFDSYIKFHGLGGVIPEAPVNGNQYISGKQ